MSRSTKNKQTRINLITNIATMIANVLVVIYYTPYLVEKLGVATYGVLPLALIINHYISIATGVLTNSFTRFYSVALQKEEYDEASKVISTSFLVVAIIIICLMPILGLLVPNVDKVFQIPIGVEESAKILFLFTILSFFFSIVSSLLNVTLYALNRLDLMNYIKIARQVLKYVLVVVFFQLISIDLYFVGLANLSTEVLLFGVSLFYFFKFKPAEVRISMRYYSKPALIAIMTMSMWVLLQEFGDTIIYRTDNLLVNHFLGAEASGMLGAISELGNYIKVLVSVLGSLFGPLILIAYSRDNHSEVRDLSVSQTLVVGCISAILCGVTAGLSGDILSVWLNDSFVPYKHWLILKLIPIPFFAAGGVLSFVYRAWNKVKFPAIATCIIGLLDLGILIFIGLIVPTNLIAEVILFTCTIFTLIQSYFLGIYCVYKIYPECGKSFLLLTLKIVITILLSYLIAYGVGKIIPIQGFSKLAIDCIVAGLVSLVIVTFFVLNKQERYDTIKVFK